MAKRKPAQVHGILCVDKPLGLTSRAVVNQVGRLLGERRAGHAGTLDPAASGMLLVALGEATKAMRWLTAAAKTYETTIALGTATLSDDADGEVIRTAPVSDGLTAAQVLAALPQPGWIAQVPPAVSALLQDGVRDHERVRRGELVVRPARQVRLDAIAVLGVDAGEVRLRLTCGAGFYVRSLARDLGEALGTAAHVRTLRRTEAGGCTLAQAVELPRLAAMDPDERQSRLVSLEAALAVCLPSVWVDAATELALRQGKLVEVPEGALPADLVAQVKAPRPADDTDLEAAGEEADGPDVPALLVLAANGTAVCVAEVVRLPEGLRLKVVRGFVPPVEPMQTSPTAPATTLSP